MLTEPAPTPTARPIDHRWRVWMLTPGPALGDHGHANCVDYDQEAEARRFADACQARHPDMEVTVVKFAIPGSAR